jgi:tetrapyrrole methylase family protein/MazG family protein
MNARQPTFDDLVAIMARLRGPGGCPWDREQTHCSLRPYLVEETYEALEAIDAGTPAQLRQELGDLLLQVVFHAQMAAEAGAFSIGDVIAGLVEKLIRRHPHVFGDVSVAGPGDVLANWETIKEQERSDGLHEAAHPGSGSALGEFPLGLPALMLAQRMQERAARAGFPGPDLRGALENVGEELSEVKAAAEHGDGSRIAAELGDLLFAAANLPRHLGLDGEQALREACGAFRERFARVEEAARSTGRRVDECAPEELAAWWRAAG